MIKIERYYSGLEKIWNSFNEQAVNGTFFFNRKFMEYHGARFPDHSLLFYYKNQLVALLPLHSDNDIVASHKGLSFGGFIISNEVDVLLMLRIFENLKIYLAQQGFNAFIYKSQPYVYMANPAQDDLYALYQHKAAFLNRSILSVLDLTQPLQYSKLRQRCLRQAKMENLVIAPSLEIPAFMNLVAAVYSEAGIQPPTHTVTEMQYLMQSFPDNICLLTAKSENQLLGGLILFEHRQVVNLQYIATTTLGKQKHALDLLVDAVITKYKNKKKYLSFGSSQDDREVYNINHSLLQNKSSYGARGVVQDTYVVTL